MGYNNLHYSKATKKSIALAAATLVPYDLGYRKGGGKNKDDRTQGWAEKTY
jgi:hypothetical protein